MMQAFAACPLDDFDFHSFSTATESNDLSSLQCFNYETKPNCFPDQSIAPEKPAKRLKTMNTCATDMIMAPTPKPSISPQIISFDQQFNNAANLVSQGLSEDINILSNYDNQASQVATRSPTQAQEHVIAERKRREKLSQSFVALSAILPGLKKMDKASILGGAIRSVKQLQEQVQTLEEQAAKKRTGSGVLVKRSVLYINDDGSTISDKNSESHCDQSQLPEIKVRASGEDLLIKIHCDKQSGCAATILRELEKHDYLTVQSSSILPFGNNITDVTIIAKMNKENCITAKDLLRCLQQALGSSFNGA
uniref:Putative basic helix-loop-helix protein BHLH19 n=1 Tax=Lotus japonicus TaxID=34305 RepID=C0JP21_LOTJA|nr:putative basic helix-loop-helix protein BHLH19 [Lotus japonicus]